MKKRLIPSLLLLALLAGAFWLGLSRSVQKPTGSPVAAPASQSAPSGSAPPQAPLAVASPLSGPTEQVAPLATTAASPPAKSEAATLLPPDPAKPVTTLSALYRAFDTIDAAAEETTPSSLATLVAYAATDNEDIRSAALAGLVRRGDAAASPLLRAAAKKTDSAKQIVELLQTADYLELPPVNLAKLAARPKKPRAPDAPKPPLPLDDQKENSPASP